MNAINEVLKPLFEDAFVQFLANDSTLILADAHEQALCCRLAMALESTARKYDLNGYWADAEYNRNYGDVKMIMGPDTQEINITCDVILHSRGENPETDNLIAIEMKKAFTNDELKHKDRYRLIALTTSPDQVYPLGDTKHKYVCGYELGYFVDIDRQNETVSIEVYQSGALSETYTQSFNGDIHDRLQA